VEGWSWPGQDTDELPDPNAMSAVVEILEDIMSDLQELAGAVGASGAASAEAGEGKVAAVADAAKSGKVLSQAHADALKQSLKSAEKSVRHQVTSMSHTVGVLKAAGLDVALPDDFPDPQDPDEDTGAEEAEEAGDAAAQTSDGTDAPGKSVTVPASTPQRPAPAAKAHPLDKSDEDHVDPVELKAAIHQAVLDGMRGLRGL
ncbi:MAG: hypothetical protein ACYCW6_27785, partial [Candidatus Xenobia bacterium]